LPKLPTEHTETGDRNKKGGRVTGWKGRKSYRFQVSGLFRDFGT